MRFLLPGLALWLCTTLSADTVTLKDGSTREGEIVAEDAQNITLELRAGTMRAKIVLPRSEILAVEKKPLAKAEPKPEPAKEAKPAENAGETKPRDLIQVADGIWIKPTDRDQLVKRTLQEVRQEQGLVIGPRRDVPIGVLNPAEQERERRIEDALEKLRQSETQRMSEGRSLLARLGYYAPAEGGPFIGGSAPYVNAPPANVWYDGVGYVTPNTEFFAGYTGTGPYPYDYWSRGRGWRNSGVPGSSFYLGNNSAANFRRNYGYSPGLRAGQFSFGTNLAPNTYGYGPYNRGYSNGYNFNLNGGNRNFQYNLNFGGGSTRWGW